MLTERTRKSCAKNCLQLRSVSYLNVVCIRLAKFWQRFVIRDFAKRNLALVKGDAFWQLVLIWGSRRIAERFAQVLQKK
jgi:hypothetical protein